MKIKPKKSLENIVPYNTDYDHNYDYKLDSNENNYGPSDLVLKSIQSAKKEDICYYPCYKEVINELGKFLNLSSDQIMLTNGADEAIWVIFNAYLEPNDAVVTVTPSFAMPKIYAEIIGVDFIEVSYEKKWDFPFCKFLEVIKNNKNIKIVHLTTPNNPTGDKISKENIIKIIEASLDKLIVIDETYINYCNDNNIDLINKYENVIIVRSMSKDFALAGLRIGYIISQNFNILELKKVISPYSVNKFALKALLASIEDLSYFEKVKYDINDSKEELFNWFLSLKFLPYGSSANFLLVDFRNKAKFVYNTLKNNGIIVKKFNNDCLKNHIRITVPKKCGVKKIISLIDYKDAIIFDMDGVLIDVSSSYYSAIKKTVFYFSKVNISNNDIIDAKNTGNLNNDWDLTQYILRNMDFNISKNEIIDKFQEFYWNDSYGLINDEKLLIDINLLCELSKKYHLVLFTGRPKEEAKHTLKLFNIEKFFSYIVTMDDLPYNQQKPHFCGLNKIYNSILGNKIYYFGDTISDTLCAKNFNNQVNENIIISIGVINPSSNNKEFTKNLLLENGASFVIDDINKLQEVIND